MSIPPYPAQDEFFCLTCGRFSHHDEAVVRAHHRQCSDKRVWRCKKCYEEFMDYREAEEHVWEHWREIEQDERRKHAEEQEQQRLHEENVRREMQDHRGGRCWRPLGGINALHTTTPPISCK